MVLYVLYGSVNSRNDYVMMTAP